MEHKEIESAIALANYFISRANEEGKEIGLLKLMKLTYIAHGYTLALLDKSFINPRFDRVEAWRYGPVIPSVYYTFNHYGRNPITQEGIIMQGNGNEIDENSEFVIPIVPKEAKPIMNFTWLRYGKMDALYLVELLHRSDSPWKACYIKGKNEPIPDSITKQYYSAMYDALSKMV